MFESSQVEAVVQSALGSVFPAAQLAVHVNGELVFTRAYGWLDPETRQRPTQLDTLFDLASVTKLFVATTFMRLVERGKVALDQPVCTMLPEFSGLRRIEPYEDPLTPGAFVTVEHASTPGDAPGLVDASRVTFRHLLTHSSGLPAWRPLYQEEDAAAAQRLALTTEFSYPTGMRVVYSDIGLVLLGMSVERISGLKLDRAVARSVTKPLKLAHTRFLPIRQGQAQPDHLNIAPTEICAWRRRRIVGEVHDENAARLGGIAGHAGLFSTASDVAAFGAAFLEQSHPASRHGSDGALLDANAVAEMTRLHAVDGMTRRGLGFALWSPDPLASGNPLSEAAFGHTGFTGTSLWIDPVRSLVVACLTNRVYAGRANGGILEFRVALHRAIVEALQSAPGRAL